MGYYRNYAFFGGGGDVPTVNIREGGRDGGTGGREERRELGRGKGKREGG